VSIKFDRLKTSHDFTSALNVGFLLLVKSFKKTSKFREAISVNHSKYCNYILRDFNYGSRLLRAPGGGNDPSEEFTIVLCEFFSVRFTFINKIPVEELADLIQG